MRSRNSFLRTYRGIVDDLSEFTFVVVQETKFLGCTGEWVMHIFD